MSAIELQRKWDVRGTKLLATIKAEGEIPAGSANIPEEESTNEILEAWDDASGEDLDPDTVLAARREEIAYDKAMGVFTKVLISQCVALPEQDASQSESVERHQQGRSAQRQRSQQIGGKGVQQQKV